MLQRSSAYGSIGHAQHGYSTRTYALHPHPISASVPNGTTAFGYGSGMHNYTIPVAAVNIGGSVGGSAQGVTHVASGLVGVSTAPPPSGGHTIIGDRSGVSFGFGSGGLSLPNSSMRSGPASRHTRPLPRHVLAVAVDRVAEVEAGAMIAWTLMLLEWMMTRILCLSLRPELLSMSSILGSKAARGMLNLQWLVQARWDDEEEEDAEEEEEEEMVHKKGMPAKWDGMEMDLDMDMN